MTFEGSGTGIENSIPKIREREGNEKNPFPKFGSGKGMKKSILKVRERESEASILGNDWEREFPLTPGMYIGRIAPNLKTLEKWDCGYVIDHDKH